MSARAKSDSRFLWGRLADEAGGQGSRRAAAPCTCFTLQQELRPPKGDFLVIKEKGWRSAFTLMEVVLAIALTSVVVYLLTTAIQLYMVRVDASRSRVESAQLARTILDRIAADLTATRLHAPSLGGGGQAGGSSGQQNGGGAGQQSGGSTQSDGGGASSGGQTGSQSGGASGGGSGAGQQAGGGNGSNVGGLVGSGGGGATIGASSIQGIYGTAETIRIDRSAYGDWQRAARPVDPQEGAGAADQPATVRYYFEQGTRQTSEQLAAKGVSDERRRSNISGLYRQVIPTASLAAQTNPLASPGDNVDAAPVLMAPEVVKLVIAYYDGNKSLQQWDTSTSQGLPSGVEIILTVHEPRDNDIEKPEARPSDQTYREDELVEYRRFVRLPYVSQPQPAEALLPAPGNGNNQQNSGQSAQGGQNNNRGGQPGQGNSGGQNGGQGGSNGR